MSESNWKSEGYVPSEHDWWRATLDGREDLGYPPGYYYADTVRAIMIAFTKFFKDMYVIRYDENGFPRKKIQVPIKFGPRSKAYDFRKEEESGQTYYIPLPNMYYKLTSFQYDRSRAASSDAIRMFYAEYLMSNGIDEEKAYLLWEDTQPVPYNIGIELSVKAENFSDLLQMVEQISSKFNPDAFLFIKEFWFMNIRRDIKLKLENMSLDYQDEFGEQEKRELEAKFTFIVEGQVYTKIHNGSIIDQIVVTLNPSIETYKTNEITFLVSGADASEKKFILSDSGSNWLIENTVVQKTGEYEPGLGIYEPCDGFESAFTIYKPAERYDLFGNVKNPSEGDPSIYEYPVWQFTSASEYTIGDKYRSVFGLSGNYHPESGTYDPETRRWKGSMTDRFDFANVCEYDISSSGRKDFVMNNGEAVDTQWISKHDTEV